MSGARDGAGGAKDGAGPTRDWAVAVFVVWRDRVLLHHHEKLRCWLPCGGHVERGELPDDAAVRELLEESGVRVRLVGPHPIDAPGPRPLTRPRGVQVEAIGPDHEHVDLVYLGVPVEPYDGSLRGDESLTWCDRDALRRLPLSAEIRAWAQLALDELTSAEPAPPAPDLLAWTRRPSRPRPWDEGDNIPWHEPGFSARMLREHLSQDHDAASRRTATIDAQVAWIHGQLLAGAPTAVLDLGCGPGLYTERLARLGHRCLGIDVSPASIAHASARAAELAGAGMATPPRYVLADVRNADLGSHHGLAMMLFGELNVFRPADALGILRRVHAALAPGGALLLEPHTEAAVREIGAAPQSWTSLQAGLFSDAPHLLLEEPSWDEQAGAATVRYAVIDAATATVRRHAQSFAAYDEAGYRALLAAAGFGHVRFLASLTGDDSGAHSGLCGIVARKAAAAG